MGPFTVQHFLVAVVELIEFPVLLQVVDDFVLVEQLSRYVIVVPCTEDHQNQDHCAGTTGNTSIFSFSRALRGRLVSSANSQQDPEDRVGVHVVQVVLVADLLDRRVLRHVVARGELGDDGDVGGGARERQTDTQVDQLRLEGRRAAFTRKTIP